MKITKSAIVERALLLLNEVGIEGLSMRRLAQDLGIQAASLYWHFSNKQELLNGMADALMNGVACTRLDKEDWQAQIRHTAHDIRQALLQYRDGARVFTGTYVPTENIFRVAESIMAPLQELGASSHVAAWATFSLTDFIFGFVMEEQGVLMEKNTQAYEDWRQRKGFLEIWLKGFEAYVSQTGEG
jgi:TetR/AcrR family tetracycline transcriptional repressor